jgi:hypothetical protein
VDRAIQKAERLFRAAVDEVGRVENLVLDYAGRARLSASVAAELRRLRMLQILLLRLKQ